MNMKKKKKPNKLVIILCILIFVLLIYSIRTTLIIGNYEPENNSFTEADLNARAFLEDAGLDVDYRSEEGYLYFRYWVSHPDFIWQELVSVHIDPSLKVKCISINMKPDICDDGVVDIKAKLKEYIAEIEQKQVPEQVTDNKTLADSEKVAIEFINSTGIPFFYITGTSTYRETITFYFYTTYLLADVKVVNLTARCFSSMFADEICDENESALKVKAKYTVEQVEQYLWQNSSNYRVQKASIDFLNKININFSGGGCIGVVNKSGNYSFILPSNNENIEVQFDEKFNITCLLIRFKTVCGENITEDAKKLLSSFGNYTEEEAKHITTDYINRSGSYFGLNINDSVFNIMNKSDELWYVDASNKNTSVIFTVGVTSGELNCISRNGVRDCERMTGGGCA